MHLRSLFFALCTVVAGFAQRAPHLDPVTDITASFSRGNLRIEAPEGAHLNCSFMTLKLQKGTPGHLKVGPLPPPSARDEFGEGIWRGPVLIPVKGEGLQGEVPIVVTYQPCTEGNGGVCYPPTDQVLKVRASEIPPIPKLEKPKPEIPQASPVATPEPAVQAYKAMPAAPTQPSPKGLFWVFLGIFGFGMVSSLTPCVYPMIPITLAIIGAKGGGKGKGFRLSLVLVLGMATTYTAFGVAAARAGAAFGAFAQHPAFLIPVSVLFTIFAISLFGAFEMQLPESLRNKLQGSGPRKGYLGAFLMGLVLGPLSAPCVGPAILTVIVAIGKEGKVLLGGLELFTFALGMGVLFMVVGTFSAALPRSGNWLVKLKQGMGIVVLGFAAWNVRLVVPEWLNFAMWSLVMLTVMAWLEAFQPAEDFVSSLRKGLAWLALALTILLGLRAVESGLQLELLPRGASASIQPSAEQGWLQQDFEGALSKAKAEKKLILVDTYAEWCAECKVLDKETWPDARVQAWIHQNAVAVRIDAYKVRPDLGKQMKITGFPTVLLLDAQGRELRRFMGFQKPEVVLAFLEGR